MTEYMNTTMRENDPYDIPDGSEWRCEEAGRYSVLDHGYLNVICSWGSDEEIVETARMSTSKGFLGWDSGPCPSCDGLGSFQSGQAEVKCHDCGGKGTIPGDAKLLRYLHEKKHSTPFECAGLTIEVQAPIMVFREWHRHRVPFGYCLAGDTEITCIGSGGLVRHYTIEHIYRMKHEGTLDRHPARDALPPGRTGNGRSKAGVPVTRERRSRGDAGGWRRRILPSCQERTLRVLDEASEQYETARMADVCCSGIKEVFLVRSKSGHAIKASAQHRFFTREGWKIAAELRPGDRLAANGLVAAIERPIPPALRTGIGTWTAMMRSRLIPDETECYVCGRLFPHDELELDHVIPIVIDLKRALDESNLSPICVKCHRRKTDSEQQYRQAKTRLGLRWVEIEGRPELSGEEMTYDIEVEGPHRNFVANGLVVHNSEMSARYVQMPNLHYVPSVRRIIASAKKSGNKQASGGGELILSAAGKELEASAKEIAEVIREEIRAEQQRIYTQYEKLISCGVSKEIARIDTPVARYSRMRATGNLRGWLGFLALRTAPDAQFEIRQYAWALAHVVENVFPRTYALFNESRQRAFDPALQLIEEERQVVLMALGRLSVDRPGWDDMLNRIAVRIDNVRDGRAELYDKFRVLAKGS